MRYIYLKIFIWFWIAMIAVGVTLGFVVAGTQDESLSSPWRQEKSALLPLEAERVVELFEQQGPQILNEIVSNNRNRSSVEIYLFDGQENELSNHSPPPEISMLALRATQPRKVQFPDSRMSHSAAVRVIGPSGKPYVYVTEFHPPFIGPPPLLHGSPRLQIIRIIAVIGVAGLVCFWLARYITSPVGQLRSAARLLTAGNLHARVPSDVCRRNDELGDLGIDFNSMAERIQALLESQRRLIRDISHELRSPLARLRVALDLAKEGADPRSLRAHRRIEIEAESINEMVGNLLHLSRLNNLAEPPDKEELDLAELVNSAVDEAQLEVSQAGRQLLVVRLESLILHGNEQLLRSVLDNLIRNAIRYSPEGSAIEIDLRKEILNNSPYAVLSVRDHGPGVPSEHLTDIFEAFFRVEASRNPETGGTGLGLAIAKRAVLLHNGAIHARNLNDGGFEIEMHLPLGGKHQTGLASGDSRSGIPAADSPEARSPQA